MKIMSGLPPSDQSDAFFNTAIQGVAEGRRRVLINRILPLAKAGEGFRLVMDNQVVGKVILDPTSA